MNIIKNETGRPLSEVISITRRDGNKKRSYLLLNKLQAKYIPVKASEALDMFDKLADKVIPKCNGNIVVVGFAETATAIGARIAYQLSQEEENSVTYITTTREQYDITPVAEFKEEHSHAIEQTLYGDKKLFDEADYVVFAEDELTTGNTICNLVKELQLHCNYVAASILNCMTTEELQRFESHNISACCLIKTDREGLDAEIAGESVDTEYKAEKHHHYELCMRTGEHNPRTGTDGADYHMFCENMATTIKNGYAGIDKDSRILVLGTEECMYPSIVFAKTLEAEGYNAFVSATTRVPTCVRADTPLTNRFCVRSFYGDRKTYLYNLDYYDCAIVISDGTRETNIREALSYAGIKEIRIVYI